MPRYIVPFTTYASSSIEVDVPDDVTDPEEIVNLAEEKFFQVAPTLCHQCAGGRHGNPSLELGDDWQVPEHNDEYDIARLDGQD